MNRFTIARVLMTAILAVGSVSSFVLDWRSNHLLSPEWHPHARFHGALLLFFLAGVSATAIWLLWRRSPEPQTAFNVAALVSISFWTPFLYVLYFLPSASLWAGPPARIPQIAGVRFYPNVATACLFLLLTLAAWILSRKERPNPQPFSG